MLKTCPRFRAFDHEVQAVHHSLELLAHGKTKLAKPGQETLGIPGLHTIPAELVANEIVHGSVLLRQVDRRVGPV